MSNSNLKTAIQAIQAEIAHAKSGMDYYVARVEALQQTLAELTQVDGRASAPAAAIEKPQKKQAKPAAGKRGRKGKRAAAKSDDQGGTPGDLPFTGGDYWTNLVNDQPQHGSDILKAAISKLDFEPSPTQVKKLAQRMTFALNALVKANKIQDSGSGRARVFTKQ